MELLPLQVLQQAKLQERCNLVNQRLDAWCEIQVCFIPGVTLLRTLDARRVLSNTAEPKVYDRKLYLPSEILVLKNHFKLKAATFVDHSLIEMEWLLREAQAKDALTLLRSHLCVDSYLNKYKQVHARGISQNTRSQVLIKQNLARVKVAVLKYRKAREALVALEGPLERGLSWKNVLQVLEDRHVVGMPEDGIGEGSRTFSWIWMAPGVHNVGNGEKGEKVQDGTFLTCF